MSTELKSIEQACEEVRDYLQIDFAELSWIRQIVMDTTDEDDAVNVSLSIKQTVERIEQVLRCLLGEDIEIGDTERDPDRPTFIAWRGSIDERLERARPFIEKYERLLRIEVEAYKEDPRKAVEVMKTSAPENCSCYHAFAFWLCFRHDTGVYGFEYES